MYLKHAIFIVFCCLCFGLKAQRAIELKNPSFEGKPMASKVPDKWVSCGFKDESAPDIQPGSFDVVLPAFDGNTYLGLVVRSNGTYESVSQSLSEPLLVNHKYVVSIALARSSILLSPNRMTGKVLNFNVPAKLRVWGSNLGCEKSELLGESDLVRDTIWKIENLPINPKNGSYTQFFLEAYYNVSAGQPYDGNVLVDRIALVEDSTLYNLVSSKQPAPQPQPIINGQQLLEFAVADSYWGQSDSVTIYIKNQSFEFMHPTGLPYFWGSAAFKNQNLPAVHSDEYEYSNAYVDKDGNIQWKKSTDKLEIVPHSGARFLCLTTKQNGMKQHITQSLGQPLKKDTKYQFSVFLTYGKSAREFNPQTNKYEKYGSPVKLRIWGGTEKTPQMEVLAESPVIKSENWEGFNFDLKPLMGSYTHLTLEATFASNEDKAYNGNILIDDCSAITKQ